MIVVENQGVKVVGGTYETISKITKGNKCNMYTSDTLDVYVIEYHSALKRMR